MTEMTSSGPLSEVREGMTVVDATGEEVGTVTEVRMGDPDAVTADEATGSLDIAGAIAEAFTVSSGLSEQAQARLARLGHLRVDAKGLFSGNRYAAGDEVDRVTGDTVHLTITGDNMLG